MTAGSLTELPTVVVSGGTRGLGRALCLEFGQRNYQVVALYHADDRAAAALEAELRDRGIVGWVLRHDVTTSGMAATLSALGASLESGALVLINNACAPFTPKPLHLLEADELQRNWNVSVLGAHLSMQALLRPMLRARRAVVVNVLSTAVSDQPPKGFAAYVSAKAALRGLTYAYAAEYGARGIRFFCVTPGYMQTSLTDGWDERLQRMIGGSETSDPTDVAAAIHAIVENPELPGRGETYRV